MNTKKIGFIGGGNMASSLIKGLIVSGHSAQQLWVSDAKQENLHVLAENLQVHTSVNNHDVVREVDVVVLAVKPHVLKSVSEQLAADLADRNILVVSIAAGISQQSLSKWLGSETAIVRCMPNTPALVLTGATVLHANHNVNNEQKDLAENILRAVGLALWVDHESELDAVTAVSGSGPAYYFLMMEAMERAALELGLSESTARLLVQQTALGAAKIALESDTTPAELRQQVTSPGGTTEQAIKSFENDGFVQIVSKAMHAARDRSVEMSKELGDK
ncbi:MAG: pyrroline-5-carboxylate reductase [Methylococcales bacterium]|nr:pyrroline-5-carboxylate reductase [Methylococcales bacterium]